MVNVKEDLTGKTFGRWLVLGQADDYTNPYSGKRTAAWLCECSCKDKTQRIITGSNLKNGSSKSCGCYKNEKTSKLTKKYNQYDLSKEYGIGYTSKGEEFYFDLEDYDLIKDFCWYTDRDGYFATNDYRSGKKKRLSMHRLIMGEQELPCDIDHIHGKYTRNDNRKSNLRITTHSQNSMNKGLQSNNTSGVTGVSWYHKTNKWRAHIMINKKFISLGLFEDFDDAVKARKEAEEKYFGEYAYDKSITME